MGRPRTISDEAILEAARAVFMRDGTQATTAGVAREAGVSEGTIFKRFATKEDLFRLAFECGHPWTRGLSARIGTGDVRQQLVTIIGELLTTLRIMLPRVMMRAGHIGMSPHTMFEGTAEPPPVRALRLLAEWFAAEMELGRLRAHDPRLAARVVLGSVHNLVFHELVAPAVTPPTSDEQFRTELAALVLDGLSPAQPTPTSGDPRPQRPSRSPRTKTNRGPA